MPHGVLGRLRPVSSAVVTTGRSDAPLASVVVAARLGEGDPSACLEALAADRRDDVEVVLAVDGPPPRHIADLADAVVVRAGGLVPELWTAGIQASGGRRVGLLSASVVPSRGWAGSLIDLGVSGPAAVGGPIEPPDDARSIADWVVLFCRYSNHLLPIPEPGPEVAADNASYDRTALDKVADSWRDGFWEPFVHRALRGIGEQVVMRQEPVVRAASGQSLRVLMRQRLAHGREHGRRQASGTTRSSALLRAAAAPLVPTVMVLRAAKAVTSRRRLRLQLLRAVPLLWWVYACWATGEARGYVDHALGRT